MPGARRPRRRTAPPRRPADRVPVPADRVPVRRGFGDLGRRSAVASGDGGRACRKLGEMSGSAVARSPGRVLRLMRRGGTGGDERRRPDHGGHAPESVRRERARRLRAPSGRPGRRARARARLRLARPLRVVSALMLLTAAAGGTALALRPGPADPFLAAGDTATGTYAADRAGGDTAAAAVLAGPYTERPGPPAARRTGGPRSGARVPAGRRVVDRSLAADRRALLARRRRRPHPPLHRERGALAVRGPRRHRRALRARRRVPYPAGVRARAGRPVRAVRPVGAHPGPRPPALDQRPGPRP